jgi:hypothetical protein
MCLGSANSSCSNSGYYWPIWSHHFESCTIATICLVDHCGIFVSQVNMYMFHLSRAHRGLSLIRHTSPFHTFSVVVKGRWPRGQSLPSFLYSVYTILSLLSSCI